MRGGEPLEVRGADLQCPGVDVPLCREVVSLAAASWLDGANFGLGWGLVGPTGGCDNRGGPRAPLSRRSRPRRPKAPRLEAPSVPGAGCHPFIILTTSVENYIILAARLGQHE